MIDLLKHGEGEARANRADLKLIVQAKPGRLRLLCTYLSRLAILQANSHEDV